MALGNRQQAENEAAERQRSVARPAPVSYEVPAARSRAGAAAAGGSALPAIPPGWLPPDPGLERQLRRLLEQVVRQGRHPDAVVRPATLQEPQPHMAHVLVLADVQGKVHLTRRRV